MKRKIYPGKYVREIFETVISDLIKDTKREINKKYPGKIVRFGKWYFVIENENLYFHTPYSVVDATKKTYKFTHIVTV